MISPKASPSVSIVMCTYHGAFFLHAQLQSFLRQTLQPTELVVCDDCSNDETLSILKRFRIEAPFPVQIIVNRQNLGSSRNFDQALQLATGDFLALCDQDDIWHPEKLEILARLLEEDPEAGGIFSDALLIDDHDNPLQLEGNSPQTLWQLHGFDISKQALFTNGHVVDLLLKHDVVTGATMMVRASLRSYWHPIPKSWVHDGWITWILAVHSHVKLVRQPLISYRIHPKQQIGIGGTSPWERVKQRRNVERLRYASVAGQFEELREYILTLPSSNLLLADALLGKIELLHRRSRLPQNFAMRVIYIGADVAAYWKYARGWRSLLKDLLLY